MSRVRFVETSHVNTYDGDILITDPCYIGSWKGDCLNDMMQYFNDRIPSMILRDTIYGDWGCTVLNGNTYRKVGKFCADSGMVSVCLLKEALAFNPKLDVKSEWFKMCATVIRKFKGTVSFNVYEEDYEDEEDGHKWVDRFLRVEGEGTRRGKPFRFLSTQTSL